MSEPLLEVESLRFGPAGVALTGPLDLRVAAGEVLAVLGPNGAGKTTLFRTILGLVAPVAGRVAWNGRDIRELSRRELSRCAAYVPQAPAAAFDFTVAQYVQLGRLGQLAPLSAPGPKDHAAADEAIARLGLAALRDRTLSRLSGGERQLAALARAVAQRPRALVLDEPAAGLDIGNQALVLDMLARLGSEGLAIVYSTHDPNHALATATHVLVLSRGGEVLCGNPATLLEARVLARAYGTPIEEASTAGGRRIVVAGGRTFPDGPAEVE